MTMYKRFAIFSVAAGAVLLGIGAANAAEEIHFYPIESFSLDLTLEGATSGTKSRHVMDFGQTYVEIEQTTLSMMGITQSTNKRTIVQGAEVTTIDESARTITKLTNPMYENIANNVRGRDGVEIGRAFMTAMGHMPTGENRTYAGESCEMWTNAQFGQTLCATPDGIVLFITTSFMGTTMTETATSLRRGDPGPAEAYAVPDYPVQTMPNLQELLNRGRP
jgi:hypothetical protein